MKDLKEALRELKKKATSHMSSEIRVSRNFGFGMMVVINEIKKVIEKKK
jgi:hypothetical protein